MPRLWEQGRENFPEEYALTQREAVRVGNAQRIINDVLKRYIATDERGNISYVLNSSSASAVYEAFNKKGPNFKNLVKLSERVLASEWYTLTIATEGKVLETAGPGYMVLYLVTRDSFAENKVVKAVREPIDKPIMSAAERKEAREQLGLAPGNRFLYPAEWEALLLISKIATVYTGESAPTQENTSIVKSAPVLMALISVEKNSIGRFDKTTKTVTYQAGGGVEITIPADAQGVIALNDPNAAKMLDLFQILAYKAGYADTLVSIPFREFMEIRGLKDIKSAKEQAHKAIDTLDNLSFTFTDKKGNMQRIALSQRTSGVSGRGIYFRYNQDYFGYLKATKEKTEYPMAMQRLSGRSYIFARWIIDQKRRNLGRDGNIENRVSVSKLLKISGLPQPNEVPSGHIKKRITLPFDKALEDIVNNGDIIAGFTYRHRGGRELTDEETETMWTDYNLFKSLVIETEWGSMEPEYSQIRERRAAHKAIAATSTEPKKKRGRPKKQPVK